MQYKTIMTISKHFNCTNSSKTRVILIRPIVFHVHIRYIRKLILGQLQRRFLQRSNSWLPFLAYFHAFSSFWMMYFFQTPVFKVFD